MKKGAFCFPPGSFWAIIGAVLCMQGPLVAGSLEAGVKAYENGRYYDAFEDLMPAAKAGEARAQFIVGKMYEKGKGVSRDYREAAKWYEQASAQNNPDAHYALGTLHEFGLGVEKSYQKATASYQKAAAAGNAEAAENIAVLTRRGVIAPPSTEPPPVTRTPMKTDTLQDREPATLFRDTPLSAPSTEVGPSRMSITQPTDRALGVSTDTGLPPLPPAGSESAPDTRISTATEVKTESNPVLDFKPAQFPIPPQKPSPAPLSPPEQIYSSSDGSQPSEPVPAKRSVVYPPSAFELDLTEERERLASGIECLAFKDHDDLFRNRAGHLYSKYFSLAYDCEDMRQFVRNGGPAIPFYISEVWEVFKTVPEKYRAAGFKELPSFSAGEEVAKPIVPQTVVLEWDYHYNVFVRLYNFSVAKSLQQLGVPDFVLNFFVAEGAAAKFGTIYVPYLADAKNLKRTIAHEIFHLVQEQYYSPVGMTDFGIPLTARSEYSLLSRGWWMEATAEYAAHTIAYGSSSEPDSGMGNLFMPTYLSMPINYKSSHFSGLFGVIPNDTFECHEYVTSWFIHFLVSKRKVNFPDMFIWIAEQKNPSIITLLDQYLREKTGADLCDHYRDFAFWWLFDPQGMCQRHGRIDSVARKTFAFAKGETRLELAMLLKDLYTADVTVLTPNDESFAPNPAGGEVQPVFTVSCDSIKPDSQVAVWLWDFKKADPKTPRVATPIGRLDAGQLSLEIRPRKGQQIFFVLTAKTPNCTVNLVVEAAPEQNLSGDLKDGLAPGFVFNLSMPLPDGKKPERYKVVLYPRDVSPLQKDLSDIEGLGYTVQYLARAKILEERVENSTLHVTAQFLRAAQAKDSGPMTVVLMRQDGVGSAIWFDANKKRFDEQYARQQKWMETLPAEEQVLLDSDAKIPPEYRVEPLQAMPPEDQPIPQTDYALLSVNWREPAPIVDLPKGWTFEHKDWGTWFFREQKNDMSTHVGYSIRGCITIHDSAAGANALKADLDPKESPENFEVNGFTGVLYRSSCAFTGNYSSVEHLPMQWEKPGPDEEIHHHDIPYLNLSARVLRHQQVVQFDVNIRIFGMEKVRRVKTTQNEKTSWQNVVVYDGRPNCPAIEKAVQEKCLTVFKSFRLGMKP